MDVDLEEYSQFPEGRTDLKCGECQAPMVLVPHNTFSRPFYGCSRYPDCKGTHGAHANGAPLGTPANAATKRARIRAHWAFDQIWKKRFVAHRGQAYDWMRKAMKLSQNQAHIGMFTAEQCDELIRLVYRDYPSLISHDRYTRLCYGEDEVSSSS